MSSMKCGMDSVSGIAEGVTIISPQSTRKGLYKYLPTTLHNCMSYKWRHLGGKHISSYADGEEQLHGTSFAMKVFWNPRTELIR